MYETTLLWDEALELNIKLSIMCYKWHQLYKPLGSFPSPSGICFNSDTIEWSHSLPYTVQSTRLISEPFLIFSRKYAVILCSRLDIPYFSIFLSCFCVLILCWLLEFLSPSPLSVSFFNLNLTSWLRFHKMERQKIREYWRRLENNRGLILENIRGNKKVYLAYSDYDPITFTDLSFGTCQS